MNSRTSRWVGLVCLLLVGAMVFGGCTGAPSSPDGDSPAGTTPAPGTTTTLTTPEGEKVIVYALGGSWSRLMPYDSPGIQGIVPNQKIFDSFVYFDNENIVGMQAAESMESADDNYTIIVHLRKDSYFHDGVQVTAHDWEWTFKTLSQPEFEGLTQRGYLTHFKGTDGTGTRLEGQEIGVTALDDFTLKLELKEQNSPTAFFAIYNQYYFVLPKHLLEDIPVAELNESDFWNHPIGSGPCKFVSETAGTELVLEPFDDYYLGRPAFDKLIYRVTDTASYAAGFQAGEFDACWSALSTETVMQLNGQNGLHYEKMDNTIIHFLSCNNEIFTPKMIKAFDMLVDKQQIVDTILQGYGSVAISFVLPSGPYANTSLKWERNAALAKQMLEEENFDFSKTYSMCSSTPIRNNMAVIIQQNLAEIGVKVEISNVDDVTVMSGLKSGEFDLGVIQTTVFANPTFFMTQLNPAGGSYGRVQDPRYAAAYRKANLAASFEERFTAMQEAQQLMFDEPPYVPIAHQDVYMLLSAKLSNMNVPTNDVPWEWVVD